MEKQNANICYKFATTEIKLQRMLLPSLIHDYAFEHENENTSVLPGNIGFPESSSANMQPALQRSIPTS